MVSLQFQCGWIQSAEAHFHSLALISTLMAASAGRWGIKWAWRPTYLFSSSGNSFRVGSRHNGLMWGCVHGCSLPVLVPGDWRTVLCRSVSVALIPALCSLPLLKCTHSPHTHPNPNKNTIRKSPLILLAPRDTFLAFWMRGESCLGEFKWDPCQQYTGRIDAVRLKGWDAAAHFRFCWII